MNDDTPRTNAVAGYPDSGGCWKYNPDGDYVDADFARTLEREITELKERLELNPSYHNS